MSFDDHNYWPRLGNSSTKVTQSLNSEVTGHLKYSPTRSLCEILTPMSISLFLATHILSKPIPNVGPVPVSGRTSNVRNRMRKTSTLFYFYKSTFADGVKYTYQQPATLRCHRIHKESWVIHNWWWILHLSPARIMISPVLAILYKTVINATFHMNT